MTLLAPVMDKECDANAIKSGALFENPPPAVFEKLSKRVFLKLLCTCT